MKKARRPSVSSLKTAKNNDSSANPKTADTNLGAKMSSLLRRPSTGMLHTTSAKIPPRPLTKTASSKPQKSKVIF